MRSASDFNYLRETAQKYGSFWAVQEFESFVKTATDEQLRELRHAYESLETRGDAFAISRWMDDCFERRRKIPKKDFEFSSQVGQMLLLFNYLGRAGIQPFSSGNVEYVELVRKPNWDNLPRELKYLVDVAEAYGIYDSESEMVDFLDHSHTNDMEILARAAEQMRLNGHSPTINEWFKEFPLDKHQEAWMIYCLLGLMDHAGLKF